MLKSIKLFLIIAVVVFCAAAFAQTTPKESEYRIAANDLLEISVYQEPDLSKTVRVSSDGTITYPLLGDISVVGLTARRLEEKLRDLLEKDYLVNPQVSVFIKEYAKISVLGEVKRPGSYELKANLTVIQAIALAGGFTEKADQANIILSRGEGAEKENIPIDTSKIGVESDGNANIALQPDDVIIVGELGMVSVIGKVRNPGRYILKEGMTAIEAIASAGGLTELADGNRTKIIRIENGRKKTINVAVDSILKGGDKSQDVVLKPDDTIVVPESFF